MDLNSPRWPQHRKGTFGEAWYVVASDAPREQGLWVRASVDVAAEGLGQFAIWGSWFERDRCFAIKQVADAATIGRTIEALGRGECVGEVEGGGHSLRWRLQFGNGAAGENFLPAWATPVVKVRGLGFTFPHPASTLSGAVEVDGRMIEFTRVPAGQAHQWQKKKLAGWAWARCSSFAEDPDASIDLLEAIIPGGIRVPLMVFRFRGQVHRFQNLPWIAMARSRPSSPAWHFSAHDATVAIDGVVNGQPSQMVAVQYPDGTGGKLHCNNTELASMEVRVRTRKWAGGSFRPEVTLTSKSGACLEFCGREPDPRVTTLLAVSAAPVAS